MVRTRVGLAAESALEKDGVHPATTLHSAPGQHPGQLSPSLEKHPGSDWSGSGPSWPEDGAGGQELISPRTTRASVSGAPCWGGLRAPEAPCSLLRGDSPAPAVLSLHLGRRPRRAQREKDPSALPWRSSTQHSEDDRLSPSLAFLCMLTARTRNRS